MKTDSKLPRGFGCICGKSKSSGIALTCLHLRRWTVRSLIVVNIDVATDNIFELSPFSGATKVLEVYATYNGAVIAWKLFSGSNARVHYG